MLGLRTRTQINSGTLFSSDSLLISEIPSKHYSTVSSDSNYEESFLTHEAQEESKTILFDSPHDESLVYNLPITLEELTITIDKNLKNASPGLDNIPATMLKNLYYNAVIYLLSLFNAIFSQNTYPLSWQIAIILPFSIIILEWRSSHIL